MIKLNEDVVVGSEISQVIAKAIELAKRESDSVEFDFNEVRVVVEANSDVGALVKKYHDDMRAASEAYRATPEYKERAERERIEDERRRTAVLKESARTEEEMRDAPNPTPCTEKQLAEYIDSLVDRSHDYGTAVYAMSLAATAAFNYVAHKLGVTGFQASCADLDFVRRSRGIKGPFMLVSAEKGMFPQYDIIEGVNEAIDKWRPWMKEQATQRLKDTPQAHPSVIAHWKRLAE